MPAELFAKLSHAPDFTRRDRVIFGIAAAAACFIAAGTSVWLHPSSSLVSHRASLTSNASGYLIIGGFVTGAYYLVLRLLPRVLMFTWALCVIGAFWVPTRAADGGFFARIALGILIAPVLALVFAAVPSLMHYYLWSRWRSIRTYGRPYY